MQKLKVLSRLVEDLDYSIAGRTGHRTLRKLEDFDTLLAIFDTKLKLMTEDQIEEAGFSTDDYFDYIESELEPDLAPLPDLKPGMHPLQVIRATTFEKDIGLFQSLPFLMWPLKRRK